jgi:hypothetical protein
MLLYQLLIALSHQKINGRIRFSLPQALQQGGGQYYIANKSGLNQQNGAARERLGRHQKRKGREREAKIAILP